MITVDSPAQTNPEEALLSRIASEPLKGMTVERFQTMMNWEAAQPGVHPELANAFKAAAWLTEAVAFRDVEERFMAEGSHRVYLSRLIANGEMLVWEAKKDGMAEAPVLFTFEDLQSTLDSLHTTFRCE